MVQTKSVDRKNHVYDKYHGLMQACIEMTDLRLTAMSHIGRAELNRNLLLPYLAEGGMGKSLVLSL